MATEQQERLSAALTEALSSRLVSLHQHFDEVTVVVRQEEIFEVGKILRDYQALCFDTLIDLCGIDYSTYGDEVTLAGKTEGRRFAVIYHLLSVKLNQRLRVKAFCENNDLPTMPTVIDIWPTVNWFEREAFDLYGIVFTGHPDLRRILTDYGFIGNPFRKDFPLSGHVEMRYDEEQKRVIYQPVTIETREVTPHVIREKNYGDSL